MEEKQNFPPRTLGKTILRKMARFLLRLSLEADAVSGGPEPFVAFMQMAHQFTRDAGDVDNLPFVYVLANEEQTEHSLRKMSTLKSGYMCPLNKWEILPRKQDI